MSAFAAFSAAGRWFRGNCHAHSVLSDGTSSARRLAQAYRKRGYDFLVLTDHAKAQPSVAGLSDRRLLVINGIELHPPTVKKAAGGHHIVGLGVEETPSPTFVAHSTAASVIRWIRRRGGIPIYGHPYWTGHDIDHMSEGRNAFGVEAFNAVCERTRGLGDSSAHLDQALSMGFRWTVFATDDTHRLRRDACGGWTMVKARARTKSAILDAISRRRFYATQGPEIRSLEIRRGVVYAVCSPVRKIVWHAEGPYGASVIAKRGFLTRAEFRLKRLAGRSRYLRLEITDGKGRKAWSNPIWRDRRKRRWSD